MPEKTDNRGMRLVRHRRLRRKLTGTGNRPRLAVFRSLTHIYAQIIDDSQGITLASASSLDPEIRGQRGGKVKSEVSRLVGQMLARRAKEKKITQVTFDRGGHKYHGRVKNLAEGAREGGISF